MVEENLQEIQDLVDALKPEALNRVLRPLRDQEIQDPEMYCTRYIQAVANLSGYIAKLPAGSFPTYIFPVSATFGSDLGLENVGDDLETEVIKKEDLKDHSH